MCAPATCRFLEDSSSYVLYPFGYGLSYTTFSYSGLRVLASGSQGCLNPGEGPAVCVVVTVTNTASTGFKKPAEHAVPLYLTQTTLAVRASAAAALCGHCLVSCGHADT